MNPLGLVHTIVGVIALLSGWAIFSIAKGTRAHRVFGYVYVCAMLILNTSGLMIYRLFNGIGPFHVFAVVSLVSLALGFLPAYLKRPRGQWLDAHYQGIGWSYIGLVGATASELAVRLPFVRGLGFGFGIAVFIATTFVVVSGAYVLYRKRANVITIVSNNLDRN